MTLTIKSATPSDFNAIALIEHSLQDDAWQASALFDLSRQAGFGVLGAYVADKLVGYLVYQQLDIAEILRLGVAKSHQNQGIAKALLTAWLDGIDTNALLEVRTDNATAIGLYDKFGFQVIHTKKGYYRTKAGVCDAYVMMRECKG